MYAGHVGLALGTHGFRRTVPLGLLIIASQLPDWTDAGFCLAGIRPSVPGLYSHSLPAIAILAAIAAIVTYSVQRDAKGMVLVAAIVVTHVLVDYLTGIKPTWPGGPTIGLLLYRNPSVDFLLEAVFVMVGWLIYRRSLPQNRRSSWPAFGILGALLALQLAADIFMSVSPGLKKC